MKQINIYFEDDDFNRLSEFKGPISWRDFILLMADHCKESEKKGDFEIFKN